MTSTMSEHGRRRLTDGGRTHRGAWRASLDAAGRLVGSLTRSAPAAALPLVADEPDRRLLDGVIEVVVGQDESVPDIAARWGMSTAGVLALNGLGWHTPVAPGRTLLVRPAQPAAAPAVALDDLQRHLVQDGETVAAIAERHGIAPAAVLLANGLSRGAELRTGQQLVVPVPASRRTGSDAVRLTGDMRANAHLIVDAGRALGVPDDGLVVALAAAMQDSSLQNLGFGEDDAVGVLQQRPSDGWGPRAVLLDPFHAALAFFGDPASGVSAPATGLLDVEGWQLMSIGEAAAQVQRTGSAAAYGKWERSARQWLVELDRESGRR